MNEKIMSIFAKEAVFSSWKDWAVSYTHLDVYKRQSVSSEIYLEELEVDIKDLNFIIKAADELGTLLEKVISQEYGECESKITSKLNSLASSISVL